MAKEFSLRHNIYYSVVFEENPLCVLDPEARATMVTLLIQASEHLSIYLQVGQRVLQILWGHMLSSLKLIHDVALFTHHATFIISRV
jgi:hypothetical protein